MGDLVVRLEVGTMLAKEICFVMFLEGAGFQSERCSQSVMASPRKRHMVLTWQTFVQHIEMEANSICGYLGMIRESKFTIETRKSVGSKQKRAEAAKSIFCVFIQARRFTASI